MKLTRQIRTTYGAEFRSHLFEQYKLYVEMTERISGRRMLANSFFASMHTALVAGIIVLIKEEIIQSTLLGIVLIVAVFLCITWWRMIRSYRQINAAKFEIICELEQMLPVAPYAEEWGVLNAGKWTKKYIPLSHTENWVPACFTIMYFLLLGTLYYNN